MCYLDCNSANPDNVVNLRNKNRKESCYKALHYIKRKKNHIAITIPCKTKQKGSTSHCDHRYTYSMYTWKNRFESFSSHFVNDRHRWNGPEQFSESNKMLVKTLKATRPIPISSYYIRECRLPMWFAEPNNSTRDRPTEKGRTKR